MVKSNISKYIVSFHLTIMLSVITLVNSSQAEGINYELNRGNELNIDLTEIVISSLVLGFSYGVLESFKSRK